MVTIAKATDYARMVSILADVIYTPRLGFINVDEKVITKDMLDYVVSEICGCDVLHGYISYKDDQENAKVITSQLKYPFDMYSIQYLSEIIHKIQYFPPEYRNFNYVTEAEISLNTIVSALLYVLVAVLEYTNFSERVCSSDIINATRLILLDDYDVNLDEKKDGNVIDVIVDQIKGNRITVSLGNTFEILGRAGIILNTEMQYIFMACVELLAEICLVDLGQRTRICSLADKKVL
jgi:hypothetical protein